MDTLPPELLERIFSHIPLEDLLKVQSLVCKKWKNVISRELYTPWKKAYYRLKLDSMKKSNFEESSSPPPVKKSKVQSSTKAIG